MCSCRHHAAATRRSNRSWSLSFESVFAHEAAKAPGQFSPNNRSVCAGPPLSESADGKAVTEAPHPGSNEVHRTGAKRLAAELRPAYRRSRSDEVEAVPVPRAARGHSRRWPERVHSSMNRSTNLECPDRPRITPAPRRVRGHGARNGWQWKHRS